MPDDDIHPLLNPVQASDLTEILKLTPASRRTEVALAFTGITQAEWSRAAGFDPSGTVMGRWMSKVHKLPFGAAFRLADTLGVCPKLLFADYA